MTGTDALAATRAEAIILAAAAGDALGWPQEPRGGLVGGQRARDARAPEARYTPWPRMSGSRFARYQEVVEPGEYSDDTQLMLAVARSCQAGGDWREHLTRKELPAWLTYQRGGGRAVLSAASSWSRRQPPWQLDGTLKSERRVRDYIQAGANGVAMRIAPHVIWARASKEGEGQLLVRVVQDGLTTHGHPRALVGALVYATSLNRILEHSPQALAAIDLVDAAYEGLVDSGTAVELLPEGWPSVQSASEFRSTWDWTVAEMASLLRKVRASLERGSMSAVSSTLGELGALGRYAGSGTISAAAAIYLAARAGSRPLGGLLQAAYERGADTDTIASMTGGLLGAIHGREWLGSLEEVQDSDYIVGLGRLLSSGRAVPQQGPGVTPRELDRLLWRDEEESGRFVDGRSFVVVERFTLSPSSNVRRCRLLLNDGQTVLVDRVDQQRTVSAEGTDDGFRDSEGLAVRQAATVVTAIQTRHLEAIRDFYAEILGDEVKLTSAGLQVGASLRFVGSADDMATESAPKEEIEILVRSLDGLVDFADGPPVRDYSGQSIVLFDPDGRRVVLRSR